MCLLFSGSGAPTCASRLDLRWCLLLLLCCCKQQRTASTGGEFTVEHMLSTVCTSLLLSKNNRRRNGGTIALRFIFSWCTANRARALQSLYCSSLSPLLHETVRGHKFSAFLSTRKEGRAYLRFICRGGLDSAFSSLGHGSAFSCLSTSLSRGGMGGKLSRST